MTYRTAFEESLRAVADTPEGESPYANIKVPSYITAADTHNVANKNSTFLQSAAELIEDVPKFIGASLISGVNQIYNIPASMLNTFGGADIATSKTSDVIAAIDSDLAKYYEEHQEGVDTVGFIASSLIPGIGGIKILNAGQKSLEAALVANKFGTNTAKALGLLVPQKQKYITRAVNEVVNNSALPTIANGNALKAVASGLGQSVLEATAFEVAVAATMSSSPIIQNQDLGDLATNIIFGGVVFGAVGGVVDAARISSAVKRAAKGAKEVTNPWQVINEVASTSKPYERIANDVDQLHSIPEVPEGGISVATGGTIESATLKNMAVEKAELLQQRIRKDLGEISGGDQDVAAAIYNSLKTASKENKLGEVIGLEGATRMAVKSKIEKEIDRINRNARRGKASLEEVEDILPNLHVSYMRAWGDDAGKVMTEAPAVTQLIDTLKPGQRIEVKRSGVIAGGKEYKFTTNIEKSKWNPFDASMEETNARFIWVDKLPKFEPTVNKPVIIADNDIPLLEKAYFEWSPNIKVRHADGSTSSFSTQAHMFNWLAKRKDRFVNELHEDTLYKVAMAESKGKGKGKVPYKPLTQEEIAARANVKNPYLSGEQSTDAASDIFAMQSHAQNYTRHLVSIGERKATAPVIDIWNVPQHVKLSYDSTIFESLDNHVLENMVILKEQQRIYVDGLNRATASYLGEDFNKLAEITESDIAGANRTGAGAGVAAAASSNYGTLAAKVEYIGNLTSGFIRKAQKNTKEALEPLLFKLTQSPEAAIEFSTLNARLRSLPDNYALNEAGTALEPVALKEWKVAAKKAAAEGKPTPAEPKITADAPREIPIKNSATLAVVKAHIELNGKRIGHYAQIRTAQGVRYNTKPDVFYPTPIDPKEYPYFALVSDKSITGTGHTKTLYASTEEELEAMIAKLKQEPNLRIRTKGEAEEYYKSIGQFDFEKTLNENYLNHTLHRKGISAPYFVATDPDKIVSDLLKWHTKNEAGLVREVISAKYEVPFNELRRLGDTFTNIATSRYGSKSLTKYAENVVKNPYADYIKTALGIKNYSDYPFLVNVNRLADEKISQMFKLVDDLFGKAKSDDDLLKINQTLEEYGYKGAAYDESMEIFVNSDIPRGVLTSFVQKANSLLATVILRWDPLNAVNNAVSANVLLGAETKAVIRAIERGDSEAAGALAELTRIKVPGTEETVFSAQKLIANAIRRFGTKAERDTYMQFYKDHNFVTSISDQYAWTLDNLSVTGRETVRELEGKISKVHSSLRNAAEKGEKWTGNKLAEEFNRFVAADVMRQMTDIAVQRNLMTAQEQLTYINTFVNRTQGNYLAAQRPMLFHGPIGQSIGLFQTYQFNIIQQLLRHVGEGQGKDAMTLLALQGTIHGMNGLPGFNAINTHLVGNASGNTEHKDIYRTVYGAAGKEAGDWLMYGMGSNALGLLHPDLKINLYTRGDINPRHVTIVPTSPAEVPWVQASARFFGNLIETAKKLGAGGDVVNTVLQGIEHNGLSRPLAGLAQTIEAIDNPYAASYSTSNKGNVVAANDFLSFANLTRIAGGKPMDEAVAIDAAYRMRAYDLRDNKRRQLLGESIKSTLIAGKTPTTEQMDNFATQYAELGGKQENFNQWVTQLYKTANLSQVNKIRNDLNSPHSQSMQIIMGGQELGDFYD